MPTVPKIVVLEGDETGQELLEQALRLLDPDVLGLDLELQRFDLSLERRRATANDVVTQAARAMRDTGLGIKAATDHARGTRRRRVPQPDPPRGGRRQGHHPHGPPHPRRDARRRRLPADLRRPHGRRGRLRRRAVARGHRGRGRRGRLPHRADHALDLPGGRHVRLQDGAQDGRQGLRRPEVDGLARLRGDAQGGARPGGRAAPRRDLPAGPHRRDLRRAHQRRRRRPAGDPGAQPRRRLPQRPRPADVRVDRRRRVHPPGLRRALRHPGGDGRGAPRDRARPARARTSRTRWR